MSASAAEVGIDWFDDGERLGRNRSKGIAPEISTGESTEGFEPTPGIHERETFRVRTAPEIDLYFGAIKELGKARIAANLALLDGSSATNHLGTHPPSTQEIKELEDQARNLAYRASDIQQGIQ